MNREEPKVSETPVVESEASTQLIVIAKLRRALADLMRVESHQVIRPPDTLIIFRGHVHNDGKVTFEEVSQRCASFGYTVMLRDGPGGGHEIVAIKGVTERKPGSIKVNIALFLLTLTTMLYIGTLNELDPAMLQGLSGFQVLIVPLTRIHLGLPFAATLMGILLAHELSHYFVGRRYGSPVSLPYFIPFPNIFGTMGAVILQRAWMRSRKVVFDIGIAGPLGGLIVGIPLLFLGLSLSNVGPPPPGIDTALQEGNSLLYLSVKYLIFGRILPSNGEDVWLHPIAFAAWAGLWLTMMNLVPVGQLDGGHVSYAILGHRARTLGLIIIVAMVVWGGWLLAGGNEAGGIWLTWGFMNLMLNSRHPPPLDDMTKLNRRRVVGGLLMLVLFILLFMPAPLQQVQL